MEIHIIFLLNLSFVGLHLATQTFSGQFRPRNEIFKRQGRSVTRHKYLRSYPEVSFPLGSKELEQARNKRKTEEDVAVTVQDEGLEEATELLQETSASNGTENPSNFNDVPLGSKPIYDVDRNKIFGGYDGMSTQHPFWLFLRPFVQKLSGVVSYLTHPNVALTPFYLLSRLKQRFYEHVKDKIGGYTGDFQEHPYPYKFN
ncbi:hypothetical protein Trydic_g21788 [Trypoxylus dichotomus]